MFLICREDQPGICSCPMYSGWGKISPQRPGRCRGRKRRRCNRKGVKKRECRPDEQPDSCSCPPACVKCPEGTKGVRRGWGSMICLPALPCPASTSRGTEIAAGSSEMVAKHAEAIIENAEKILGTVQGTSNSNADQGTIVML